jgi:hypothetical protein
MLKNFLTYIIVDHPKYLMLFLITVWLLFWYYYLPNTHILKYYTISASFEVEKEHTAGRSAGWYVIYLHTKSGSNKKKIIIFSIPQTK